MFIYIYIKQKLRKKLVLYIFMLANRLPDIWLDDENNFIEFDKYIYSYDLNK